MKILKFILITIIIICIAGIVPLLLYKTTMDTSSTLEDVEGTEFKGLAGYYSKIILDQNVTTEIRENANNMLESATKILNYKNTKYNTLVIYLLFVLDVFIIAFGIILNRLVSNKSFGNCFILAGIISLIICIYILVMIGMEVV